jgi:hypothetical protein
MLVLLLLGLGRVVLLVLAFPVGGLLFQFRSDCPES